MSQSLLVNENVVSPDSLDTLLKKVRVVHIVNGESLAHIHSCQGKQVIISQTYTLHAKRKYDEADFSTSVENEKGTRKVEEIVKSWRYKGETLTKELIAFNDFIDRRLNKFEDLTQLHGDYESLIEKYSRLLVDEPESRAATATLLHNMELMQVAIGEIHAQTFDVEDPLERNELVSSCMKNINEELKRLKTIVPSMNISLILNGKVSNEERESSIVNFQDVEKLSCT